MGNNGFVKVFDVLDSGFRGWIAPSLFLAMVIIYLSYHYFIPYFLYKRPVIFFIKPYFAIRNASHNVLQYAILFLFTVISLFAFVDRYSRYLHHKGLLLENRCNTIEGKVENFRLKTGKGGYESFSVSGVRFRYSNDEETDAFNGNSSRGVRINEESYVRICYDPADKAILRLEIRS